MKIFYFFVGFLMLMQTNSWACQYGMDSAKRADEALLNAHPGAHSIEVLKDMRDVTFSFSAFSNDCPSDFRLAERVRFVENENDCSVKIVLIYRDHHFVKSKLRALTCTKKSEK